MPGWVPRDRTIVRRHRHPAPRAPPPPRPPRDRRCCPRTSRGVRDRRGTDRHRRWATPSSGRWRGADPSPRSRPPRRSPSRLPERCHREAGRVALGRRGGRATRARAPSPGRSHRRHPRHRRGAPKHAPGPRARPRRGTRPGTLVRLEREARCCRAKAGAASSPDRCRGEVRVARQRLAQRHGRRVVAQRRERGEGLLDRVEGPGIRGLEVREQGAGGDVRGVECERRSRLLGAGVVPSGCHALEQGEVQEQRAVVGIALLRGLQQDDRRVGEGGDVGLVLVAQVRLPDRPQDAPRPQRDRGIGDAIGVRRIVAEGGHEAIRDLATIGIGDEHPGHPAARRTRRSPGDRRSSWSADRSRRRTSRQAASATAGCCAARRWPPGGPSCRDQIDDDRQVVDGCRAEGRRGQSRRAQRVARGHGGTGAEREGAEHQDADPREHAQAERQGATTGRHGPSVRPSCSGRPGEAAPRTRTARPRRASRCAPAACRQRR